MRRRDSEAYWDERARENALYFVDNQLEYGDPDSDAFWKGGEEIVDVILDAVGVRVAPSDRVLDIGCGVGRLTRVLGARADHVVGLDISSEMLVRARELNPELENVTWVHGDGTSLAGVDTASVDGCFSHVVFQHIPDPEITLGYVREMGRVLRPGGWTVFVVSTDPAIHRQRPTFRNRLRALIGRAPRGQDNPAWLGSAVDENGLREAAEDGGLEIVEIDQPGTQFTTVHAVRR